MNTFAYGVLAYPTYWDLGNNVRSSEIKALMAVRVLSPALQVLGLLVFTDASAQSSIRTVGISAQQPFDLLEVLDQPLQHRCVLLHDHKKLVRCTASG